MTQEQSPFPSCFSFGTEEPPSSVAAATKSGQSAVMSVYRTKIAGNCRLITVTWCKNLLVNGLSVSVEGSESDNDDDNSSGSSCKVELRPWHFWRRQGSKRFHVEGKPVDVFWDLRAAKFSSDPEPQSNYYVAVVSDDEVVLLLGDLKKEAFRKTGSRPSMIDAILVSKKEHVIGKRRFSTRAKFHEKGALHDISVECNSSSNSNGGSSSSNSNLDPEMVIKVDGQVAIHVKHLHWKFRGNECISMDKVRVEVYYDVHDWLFGPGLRHALFIFKPTSLSSPTPAGSGEVNGSNGGELSDFCLFLYAWKVD